MFLSREIEIKLCQNYTKSYMYQISCKILYSLYSRVLCHQNFRQWQCNILVSWYTWQQYCTAIGGNSGDLIQTIQTIPNNIINYELFNTITLIRNLIYIQFGIILTEFFINFLRQEHQIDVLYVSIKTWDSQVSAFFIFPLQSF